jgi:hypothetical protein
MSYVKNILQVLSYAPVLRNQILGVVIDRIIQIDVSIFDLLALMSYPFVHPSFSIYTDQAKNISPLKLGRDSSRVGRIRGL